MSTLLLAIIYICFISLGLPDSTLGSAWPAIHAELNVPVSYMGFISMSVSFCTIISALFSDKLIRKFSTRTIVAFSIFLTIIGMAGFAFSNQFWLLILFAIPYGLGAGAIDSSLNNYVALHYSAKHLSWLHCFWGVGTLVGPYAMSYAISSSYGWRLGYIVVGVLQIIILAIVLITFPLWKKAKFKGEENNEEVQFAKLTFKQKLSIKGVIFILIAFFAYCSLEQTGMVWASTYFNNAKGLNKETSAALGSLFYIGITVGRFISGFISSKLNDKQMIRLGIAIIIPGIILLLLPFDTYILSIIGLIFIGLGCAPIYPCIIHSTPINFGKENSQAIIGLEMAFAYVGTTLMPPLFGVIASYIDIRLYPIYLSIFLIILIICSELTNKKIKSH